MRAFQIWTVWLPGASAWSSHFPSHRKSPTFCSHSQAPYEKEMSASCSDPLSRLKKTQRIRRVFQHCCSGLTAWISLLKATSACLKPLKFNLSSTWQEGRRAAGSANTPRSMETKHNGCAGTGAIVATMAVLHLWDQMFPRWGWVGGGVQTISLHAHLLPQGCTGLLRLRCRSGSSRWSSCSSRPFCWTFSLRTRVMLRQEQARWGLTGTETLGGGGKKRHCWHKNKTLAGFAGIPVWNLSSTTPVLSLSIFISLVPLMVCRGWARCSAWAPMWWAGESHDSEDFIWFRSVRSGPHITTILLTSETLYPDRVKSSTVLWTAYVVQLVREASQICSLLAPSVCFK